MGNSNDIYLKVYHVECISPYQHALVHNHDSILTAENIHVLVHLKMLSVFKILSDFSKAQFSTVPTTSTDPNRIITHLAGHELQMYMYAAQLMPNT